MSAADFPKFINEDPLLKAFTEGNRYGKCFGNVSLLGLGFGEKHSRHQKPNRVALVMVRS